MFAMRNISCSKIMGKFGHIFSKIRGRFGHIFLITER